MPCTFIQEKETLLRSYMMCWGSVSHSGQEGRFKPPQLWLCGQRDGQEGWVGCSPFPGQRGGLGKLFPPSGRQQQGMGCLQAAFGFKLLVRVQS